MTEPDKAVQAQKVPVPVWWSADPAVQQVYGDEAIIQAVGDHIYLSFGQAQVPSVPTGIDRVAGVEIRPVARVVLTHAAFQKVVKLASIIAAHLPDAATVAAAIVAASIEDEGTE